MWQALTNGKGVVDRGARLFSTNPDRNRPTADGIRPGCGARETDILGGVQPGYRTVLVPSGGTRVEHIPGYS